MLLSAKYCPKRAEEFIGNEDRIKDAKQWMLQWVSGKKRKPLLLWGPPGVGKTTLAYAFANEFDYDVIEINASQMRNRAAVERIIKPASMAGSLFGRGRLVLIDDADVLAGVKDSGGSGAIAAFLKECACPTIVTATDIWDKKLSPIRVECESIEFKKVSKVAIRKLLERIGKEEKLDISAERIATISENAGGDVRAALNDLQVNNTSSRDSEKDIFQLVRGIFKAERYSDVKELMRGDIDYDFIKLWMDQNIPNEYETAYDIFAAYDSLSKADIFDGRIRKSKWQLLKYSIDLATAGVSLAKKAPYHKFTKYEFPSYLRMMSQSMARRAMLKSIGGKIGARLHSGRRAALEFLPLIKEFGAKSPDEVVSFYNLEEEEFAFIMETAARKVRKTKES